MFDWLFKPLKFKKFQDSFAMSRSGLWSAVGDAIRVRRDQGELVLVVAHFADTFMQLQERVETWGMDYEIERKMIDQRWMNQIQRSPGGVYEKNLFLILASQLADILPEKIEKDSSRSISIMVVERHPLFIHDQAIEDFCQNVPYQVQLGYFVSLTDPFIQRILGEDTLKLMKNLGMNESELVSSLMLNRRITKMQAKYSKEIKTDHPADSAEEWFQLNDPVPNEEKR